MPAIPAEWMDTAARLDLWTWAAHAHHLLAPQVHLNGHMALIVLGVVLWAFSWLLFRAWTVLHTPNELLVDKLGLDIPPEPTITLEEISARHVQISWKPEESNTSVHEYHLELNGRTIGLTKKHETAAVISNLHPSTLYELRIFSISPGRFQTPSRPLNIRTSKVAAPSSPDGTNDGHPVVRPLTSRHPSVPVIAPVPPAQREPNATLTTARRGTNPRKPSPAGPLDASPEPKDLEDDQGEDLAELSQQFSEINAEIDDIESNIQAEVLEFDAAKKEKEAQRQSYLHEVKERDEASNDLRKHVHRAENASRSLLNERTKKEKQVKDKESGRQKRLNEMAQWDKDVQDMAEEIEAINKQKEVLRRRMESQVREVREKIAEEQREIQQIEDDNKEKAQQLKELQDERKRNSADEDTEESREADRRDQERDYIFRQTVANLSHQYNQIWQELQRQQQQHVLARQRFTMLETQRRAAGNVSFVPMPSVDMDLARRNERMPSRARPAGSHGSNVSSPRMIHAPEPFGAVTPAVATASPLTNRVVNFVNGMTLPMDAPVGADEEEDDHLLTAPMSPRADALLPTDLLGDDSEDDFIPDEDDVPAKPAQSDVHTSPFPTFQPDNPHPADGDSEASPSPGSTSSPRSFASPNEESCAEGDQDRRSIRSSHPPIPEDAPAEPPTHKRLTSMSNLFSFNRARGKTASGSGQPPALGSLKHESHSFPRKVDDFDAANQPRRRLSYGGNWAFPGGNFLGKQNDEESDPVKPSFTRRAFPFGMGKSSASRNYDPFGVPRNNSLDPSGRGGSSSPRPGSTYSFDVMPRMSMEDSFNAWRYDRGPARNSPLVPDWASSYSRSHSRRPSMGLGSQTNLSLNASLNPTDEGEFVEPRRDTRPLQAPIGTRPTSSQRPATPKLNPNAPTFTMFKFGKNKDKASEKDKDKLKGKDDNNLAGSPPESRKSKDTHSIAPTTSTLESHDSLERTTSGLSFAGTGTASLESTSMPISNSKATFISKITRKASSNKFDSWKTKSTSIFSSRSSKNPGEATTPTGETTEDEHAGSTEHLGRSVESTSSTPGAGNTPSGEEKKGSRTSLGSWNFMRKKQKASSNVKEDLTASEISENGETVGESGNTTDHDVDASGGESRPMSATAAAT